MPPKTLALAGVAIMWAAVLIFWGTDHWLRTRIFEPGNTPISLSAGHAETGNFEINLRTDFYVYVDLKLSPQDQCNSDSFPRISWKVVRLPAWYERSSELWATSDQEWGNTAFTWTVSMRFPEHTGSNCGVPRRQFV
jgi:hypothetical protein